MDDRDNKGRFLKGRRETEQEKIARINAYREAWKKSEHYIGDIVNECPYIYNSWRAIMFTEKGKRAGVSDEWRNFRTFYNDVRPTYVPGYVLRRTDSTKVFSKDNFIWLSKSDAASMTRENTIRITYNGDTLTIKDWADKLGVTVGPIRYRYYKHPEYTSEEWLFGKKIKRGTRKAKDVTDSATKIRAKASKMISSYRNKDIKSGLEVCDMSITWMIENILTKPCVYCGDTQRIGCDRIDNNKGHVTGNVVPCCIECNTARNNYFTYEEMRILGRTIADIKSKRPKREHEKSGEDVRDEATHDKEYLRRLKMRKILKCDIHGEPLMEYQSINEAAEKNGLSHKSVSAAVNGNSSVSYGGHKLKGYLWYKKEE